MKRWRTPVEIQENKDWNLFLRESEKERSKVEIQENKDWNLRFGGTVEKMEGVEIQENKDWNTETVWADASVVSELKSKKTRIEIALNNLHR